MAVIRPQIEHKVFNQILQDINCSYITSINISCGIKETGEEDGYITRESTNEREVTIKYIKG